MVVHVGWVDTKIWKNIAADHRISGELLLLPVEVSNITQLTGGQTDKEFSCRVLDRLPDVWGPVLPRANRV